jgi:hypothetical protein
VRLRRVRTRSDTIEGTILIMSGPREGFDDSQSPIRVPCSLASVAIAVEMLFHRLQPATTEEARDFVRRFLIAQNLSKQCQACGSRREHITEALVIEQDVWRNEYQLAVLKTGRFNAPFLLADC